MKAIIDSDNKFVALMHMECEVAAGLRVVDVDGELSGNLHDGCSYINGEWVFPCKMSTEEKDMERKALSEKSVRSRRQSLLLASDWTQLPDVPQETKTMWLEYRQLLRDITEQEGFPFNVIWPTVPQ